MKWSHDFEYETFQKTYRVYKCGDIRIRVDFFEHMLRVAVYKKGQRSVPTYSVCPGECKMPRHGRSRLSTEGFTPLPQEAEIRIDDVDIDIGFTREFRIRYRKGWQGHWCNAGRRQRDPLQLPWRPCTGDFHGI